MADGEYSAEWLAAQHRRLVDQFDEMLALQDAETIRLYGLRWALLADHVNHHMCNRRDLRDLIGKNPVQVMTTNHACHVNFMHSVFRLRSARCFVAVVTWVYQSYVARGFSPDYFPVELTAWKAAIADHLASRVDTHWLLRFYDTMIERHESFLALARQPAAEINVDPQYARMVRSFLDALLAPDEQAAELLIRSRQAGAAQVPLWWEKVITPALRTIGRLWADGEITVAQEHIGTAIAQRVMSRCFPHLPQPRHDRGTVAVVVPPGEQHDVGAAMVRDCLQLAGYEVFFTGANTPNEAIAQLASQQDTRAVLVSTTMPFNLAAVQDLIDAIHHASNGRTPVLVGGQAYDLDEDLWRNVGADAYVPTLDAAVERVGTLAAAG